MTINLKQRLKGHRVRRKDLYSQGFSLKILSQHKNIDAAALAEAKAILERNTLEPHGNNRHRGGLMGPLRQLAKQRQSLASGAHFLQAAKDAIAVARRAKNTGPLSAHVQWRRKRDAWKRHLSGLAPLPGTEHLLETPIQRKPMPKTANVKRSATMKAKFAAKKKQGESVFNDEAIVTLSIKQAKAQYLKNPHFNILRVERCVDRAKKRQKQGLDPIPGTEIFLRISTTLPWSQGITYTQRRQHKEQVVDAVNAWMKNYAIEAGWVD